MRNVARSTRPPSNVVVSVSISASLSACSSRRGAAPSFQSETIASDTGSSERTATTTVGPPGRARSCTSVADTSSSRSASSTQIDNNVRVSSRAARRRWRRARSSRGASRSSVGTRWARADNGTTGRRACRSPARSSSRRPRTGRRARPAAGSCRRRPVPRQPRASRSPAPRRVRNLRIPPDQGEGGIRGIHRSSVVESNHGPLVHRFTHGRGRIGSACRCRAPRLDEPHMHAPKYPTDRAAPACRDNARGWAGDDPGRTAAPVPARPIPARYRYRSGPAASCPPTSHSSRARRCSSRTTRAPTDGHLRRSRVRFGSDPRRAAATA